ncbi:Clathrin interactor 1 [Armadillidium vulgare]|nr:Clathrin interactor 1 [Armadillidium vulgare]
MLYQYVNNKVFITNVCLLAVIVSHPYHFNIIITIIVRNKNLYIMISMWKVRELTEKVTNMVMNYTEIEAKVREATNDEAWGPTGPQMLELAQATFYYEQFPEVMGMLWKRMLQDNKTAWRRTYKSLLLLAYLVRNGSERVVTSAREHIYDLRSLENYKYIDELGKDQGLNIRVKVKELIDFIQDDNRLRDERKKAKKNRDKYIGVSSDTMGFRSSYGEWDDWGTSKSKPDPSGSKGFKDSPTGSGDEAVDEFVEPSSIYKDGDASPKISHNLNSSPSLNSKSSSGKIELGLSSPSHSGSTVAPKKSSKPSRMVSLGAAAQYAKESQISKETSTTSQATKQSTTASNNLLEEIFESSKSNGTSSPAPKGVSLLDDDFSDFNPRETEQKSTSSKENDFGNFSSVFGGETKPKTGNEEFADFSSFQSPSVTPQAPSGNSLSNSSLLMDLPSPNTGPPLTNSTITPNNNLNFLDGLLEPSSTTPSGSSVPMTAGANNADLLSGLTSSMTSLNIVPSSANVEEEDIENPKENSEKKSLKSLLGRLHKALEKNEKRDIEAILNVVCDSLPGPFCPQKYSGLDCDSNSDFVLSEDLYANLFSTLCDEYFRKGCLRRDRSLKKLFFYIINNGYFECNIKGLCHILKNPNAITGTTGRWANSGVNINLDNLLQGTPKKTPGPPMNRMNPVAQAQMPSHAQGMMMGGIPPTVMSPHTPTSPTMGGVMSPLGMRPMMSPMGAPGMMPQNYFMGMPRQMPSPSLPTTMENGMEEVEANTSIFWNSMLLKQYSNNVSLQENIS